MAGVTRVTGVTPAAAAPREATMLELVWEASANAASPDRVIDRVARQLRAEEARLRGNFRGVPVGRVLLDLAPAAGESPQRTH